MYRKLLHLFVALTFMASLIGTGLPIAAAGGRASIALDGLTGDWTGIDPLISEPGDTGQPPDIVAAYMTDDGANLYIRIDSINIGPGVPLSIGIDADRNIATGYNTNTNPSALLAQTHGVGIDYVIAVVGPPPPNPGPPTATLYSVAGPAWNPIPLGNLAVGYSVSAGQPYIVEVAQPLNLGFPLPWRFVLWGNPPGPGLPFDEVPNNTYVTYPPATTPPTVTTDNATGITANSATLNGTLNSLGTAAAVNVFFEYGTTTNYTSTVSSGNNLTGTGTFGHSVAGLAPSTTYHFRAKAVSTNVTDNVTAYGLDKTFTTTSGGGGGGGGTLLSIQITPVNPTIHVGQTLQFQATGHYSDNTTDNITALVTWTSANVTRATIGTNTGLAQGVAVGTTTITATLGAITSNATVLTVAADLLAAIMVTPANPTITQGQAQQFTATGLYSDNTSANITAVVTWSSDNLTVASIGVVTGFAQGMAAGSTTIRATLGAINGSTVLTVAPAGPSGSISGRAFQSDNTTPIAGASVAVLDYLVSPPHLAGTATTNATGGYTVVGLAPGQYSVSANATGYALKWYNNTTYYSDATPVTVAASADTPNVNFSLVPGGTISGRVWQSDNTTAISGATVIISSPDITSGRRLIYHFAQTGADGSYQTSGLPAGQYLVRAQAEGYATKWYNNTYDLDDATAVSVTVPNNTPNINFSLAPGGTISGHVYQSNGTTPVNRAAIDVFRYDSLLSQWISYGRGQSGTDGSYRSSGLPAGQYGVRATATGYATEWYDSAYNWQQSTQVTVTIPNDTPNINFTLDTGGSISGLVFQSNGTTPLTGAKIDAYEYSSLSGKWLSRGTSAYSAADGSYTLSGLPNGQYGVRALATGYAIGWYSNTSFKDRATPVAVTAPNDTPNINFSLGPGGSVSGRVFQSDNVTPIAGVNVYASDGTSRLWTNSANTDASGDYTISNLPADSYLVRAYPPSNGLNYTSKWYSNVYSQNDGTLVPVTTANTTPNINFSLEVGGAISGHVYRTNGTTPVAGASVYAEPLVSTYGVTAYSATDGGYTIPGLLAGQYRVRASTSGAITEYYSNVYTSVNATPVTATASATTPNIDFTLDTGGTISGRVFQSDNVTPIAGARIDVYDFSSLSGSWVGYSGVNTGADGSYRTSGLPNGQYGVRVTASGYATEWYNNTYFKNQATPVAVVIPNDTPNINFSLGPGGSISGTVRNAAGSATLASIGVEARRTTDGNDWHTATSDGQGNYTISGLPPGQYEVRSPGGGRWGAGDDNYVQEYYNNRTTEAQADLVTVATGGNASGINFTLAVGGSISGRVFRSDGVTPISGVHVYASDNNTNQWMAGVNTDSQGNYTLHGLPSGSLFVRAYPYNSRLPYIDEWYNNAYIFEMAIAVPVTSPNDTPGINFSLEAIVVRPTTEQAIQDGNAWLAAQQSPDGSWGTGFALAKTALAVLKLASFAKEHGTTPFAPGYAYSSNVTAGLNYLFAGAATTTINVQIAGNPDVNGNGLGVFFNQPDPERPEGHPIYNTAIALMAIAASGEPSRVVSVAGSPVNGRTYAQVAQDVVDYLAWAQTDTGYGRGGWDYWPRNNAGPRSDQSNSGWVTLAFAYAEAAAPSGLGLTVPGFVRTELNTWIDYIQNDVNGDPEDGGADYTGPLGDHVLWVNVLKTGNLLQQMAFVGDTPATPRVQDAINFLVRHWPDNYDPGWRGNPTCYHSTYTVMKGLEALNLNSIGGIGGIDWYPDFTAEILGEQSATGWWPSSRWDDGERILSSEWALLTLERAIPPTAQKPDLTVFEKHETWVSQPAGTYTVQYTIKNVGNVQAPAGHFARLTVDNVTLENKAIPVTLNPGAIYTDNFTTVITLTGGSDNITVRADATNIVDELNEDNNTLTNTWPAPSINISLQPPQSAVGVGQTFDLTIQVTAGGQPVDGASVFIDFDASRLAVVDTDNATAGTQITPGTALPVLIQNTANNAAGTIDFSAGKLGEPFPTGTFIVATIRFQALAATDNASTAVVFSFTGIRTTVLDYGGNTLPTGHSDATVQISSGATVNVSVVLQGGNRPDSGWAVPVTVKFFAPGGNVLTAGPIRQASLTTTKSGSTAVFTVGGIPPATYDITVVSEHTLLHVKRNVVISAPSTPVAMGMLLEGDANNSNIININDFGILAVAFMKTSGQPGWDARADFDRNGIVNVSDFGLLAVNFMKTSPQEVP